MVFYVFCNIIVVMSRQWKDSSNESLCAMKSLGAGGGGGGGGVTSYIWHSTDVRAE